MCVWYFLWYGQNVGHGELVAGILACGCFGQALVYSISVLNNIADRSYVSAIFEGIVIYYLLAIQIRLLHILAGHTPIHSITAPYNINPHLIGPLIFIAIICFALIVLGMFVFIDWWSSPANLFKCNNYPGKLLLTYFKLGENK